MRGASKQSKLLGTDTPKRKKLTRAANRFSKDAETHRLAVSAVEAREVAKRSFVQGEFSRRAQVLRAEGRTGPAPLVAQPPGNGPRQHLVRDVGREEHVGKTEEDEVEEPEAEDGHGGKRVEAHVGAARHDGVADKSLPLVTEEGESGQQEEQQAQDQHRHPPGFT